MRRRGQTSQIFLARLIKPSKNRFTQSIGPRPRNLKASQDSEISTKSPKRVRNKPEYVRPKALIPDNIRLNNYISCPRMSPDEFKNHCTDLTSKCSKEFKCGAHESLRKLRKISSALISILFQSKEVSADWDKNKKVHNGSYSQQI